MEGHFEVKPELFEIPQSVLEVSLSFHLRFFRVAVVAAFLGLAVLVVLVETLPVLLLVVFVVRKVPASLMILRNRDIFGLTFEIKI